MCAASLLNLTIREVAAGFRRRDWSPVEVTRAALERIEATDSTLHAWAFVDSDAALAAAARAARELQDGLDRGPLHGVPVGVKDIFDVIGWPTRCGSASRDDARSATENATSVSTLIDAGAVLLGKTVTQEFAAGTISPPSRNPWDPERIPGGSSGGSAAAVGSGDCFGALGSDTGGSIRIPAAACGVTGFKPAYGALDATGVFPLAWSLDTVGPIARTVGDTWAMWAALRRGEEPQPIDDSFLAAQSARRFRVGVPRPHFFTGLQPDVTTAVNRAIERLEEVGVQVVDSPWPSATSARASAFIINRVETAAVHERIAREEPDRFSQYGPDLRLRIAAGSGISSSLYLQALRARVVLRDSMATLFGEHRLDALITPTLPTTALRADDLVVTGTGLDESVGIAWTRLTMPFNATGQPVLALPCGFDSAGLPVGLQLAGEPGKEAVLFQIGRLLEGVLHIHDRQPRLLATMGETL